MDLLLARTFLEVVSAGSFSAAAERLHVTQSTVSARIHGLEEELGRPLFERGKTGANPTAAGRQFQRHAAELLRTWETARREVALPEGYDAVLRIGSEVGLWMRLLYRWIPWMRMNFPHVALRVESAPPDILIQRMMEGSHDLSVMVTPQSRPGLKVEQLVEERLVLVSTADSWAECADGAPAPGYVYVDWGREFRRSHNAHFPDFVSPGLVIGVGLLAFKYVLENGGAGYFPQSLVEPHLTTGVLTRVPDAPAFSFPIFLVSPFPAEQAFIREAASGLRRMVEGER